jgi:serine/threonine protein phosphatase PrpC
MVIGIESYGFCRSPTVCNIKNRKDQWWREQYVQPSKGHLGVHYGNQAEDDDRWIYNDEWAKDEGREEEIQQDESKHEESKHEESKHEEVEKRDKKKDWRFAPLHTHSNDLQHMHAARSSRNRRRTMEDRCTATLLDKPRSGCEESDQVAMYAVFDGHGSAKAAEFCQCSLPKTLLGDPDLLRSSPHKALVNAYRQTEERLLKALAPEEKLVGTTCITALLQGDKLTVANVGDSRAVLVRESVSKGRRINSGVVRTVALSRDHKPSSAGERERLERGLEEKRDRRIKSGEESRREKRSRHSCERSSHSCHNSERSDDSHRSSNTSSCVVPIIGERVGGILNMTRAMGDAALKHYGYISAEPEVTSLTLDSEEGVTDSMVVLGSDGLWTVMSTEEVGLFASRAAEEWMASRQPASDCGGGSSDESSDSGSSGMTSAEAVAEALVAEAKARGSCDNISVVVVDLHQRQQGAQQ